MRGKRATRPWRYWIVGALVLVAVLGGSLLALPRIVEGLLVRGLETAGIPVARVRVADVGWSRTTIADLALGTERELTADAVVVAYSPFDLARGRIDDILVRGLRLRVRADGEGPPLGSLDAALEALGGDGGDGAGPPLPDVRIADGRITLLTPLGPVPIPVVAEITTAPDGGIVGNVTVPPGMVEGPAFVARTLRGDVRFTVPPDAPLHLSAHLAAANLTLADAPIATASLDAELDGDGGTARILLQETADHLTLDAAATVGSLSGRTAVEMEVAAGASAESVLWRLLGLPPATESRASLTAALAGRISIADGAFALESSEMTLAGLAPAGLALAPITLSGTASGTVEALSGRARIEAGLPGLTTDAVRLHGLTLSALVGFAVADGRLTVRLEGGDGIDLQTLVLPGQLALEGPVRLPLAATDEPSVTVDFASANGPTLDYDLAVGPATLTARLRPDAAEPVPVDADLRTLSLAGSWAFGIADAARRIEFGLGLAELTHRADPAIFAPLSLEADGRLLDDRLEFAVHASPAGTQSIELTMSGHHDLRTEAGGARINLRPLAFAPDGLEPEDLMPVLGGRIEQATGTVGLAGGLSWTADGSRSDLRLLLQDLSFTTPQAEVARLNTVIRLDGLLPLSTPPDQKLAVGLIDVGVPLTDGVVDFRIEPGGRLAIASGRLRFAGGEVSVEPTVIDLAEPENTVRLLVEDVALGDLAALAEVEGLSATGRLDGRIPVRLGEGVVIENGVLSAEAPGRLSYAPAQPPAALQAPGETVSLLLSALTNFQYEDLRLTVDRTAGGEMVVAVHVEGQNPDFYDGYPVELNFNISGELDQVLHRGLVGYRIPEAIRERLSEFPD